MLLHRIATLPWFSCPTHLVAITRDCDEEAEGRSTRDRSVVVSLLSAPAAILKGVDNHITRVTVIPRVKMESNVRTAAGTTLQIHMEPGERHAHNKCCYFAFNDESCSEVSHAAVFLLVKPVLSFYCFQKNVVHDCTTVVLLTKSLTR